MDRKPIRALWNEHVEQCPNCKYVYSVLRRPYIVPSVPYFSTPKFQTSQTTFPFPEFSKPIPKEDKSSSGEDTVDD